MLIVGNWKAYVNSGKEAKALAVAAKKLAVGARKHQIVIAPPAPYLGLLIGVKSKLGFAAQDVSLSTGGAATGEVTASLLYDLGARFVIIGHSERRAGGETDVEITQKVKQALTYGLTPILCIGERERDTDAKYLHVVRAQIDAVFATLTAKERARVVLAYEPIWAIGKSAAQAITATELTEMILYIRKILSHYLAGKGNLTMRILYGGSVEPANASELAGGTGIDGFLIGHASTTAAQFSGIVKAL